MTPTPQPDPTPDPTPDNPDSGNTYDSCDGSGIMANGKPCLGCLHCDPLG